MKHSNNKLTGGIFKSSFYLQIRTLYCLLLITFLTSSLCFSQETKEYFDKEWKKTSEKNATYYRVGSKDNNETWEGPFKDFYINGEVLNEGTFVKGSKEGSFISYYPEGKPKSKGEYKKDIPVGKWQSWYKNGQLKEDYFYTDTNDKNKFSFNDRIRHENFYDSLGVQLVKEGTGSYYSFHDNNIVEAKGPLKNYLKDGDWVGYREDGSSYYNETYEEGKLISGTSWDKMGKSYSYTQLEAMPQFKGGQNSLTEFMRSNLRYPVEAARSQVEGTVYISFIVEGDGSIADVKVSKGIGYGCDEEASRIVWRSPKWEPGTIRGQGVRVRFSLPFRFKLGGR